MKRVLFNLLVFDDDVLMIFCVVYCLSLSSFFDARIFLRIVCYTDGLVEAARASVAAGANYTTNTMHGYLEYKRPRVEQLCCVVDDCRTRYHLEMLYNLTT